MEWDDTIEERFTALRLKEIEGSLTPSEQDELTKIMAAIEADEGAILRNNIEQIREEQLAIRKRATQLQQENEALASLLVQQEEAIRRLMS